MAFEIYTGPARRRGVPKVTISKRGRIIFNKAAARLVEGQARVALSYDAERQLIAIEPFREGEGAYPFELKRTVMGASIPAKRFFDHFKIELPRQAELRTEAQNGAVFLSISA